MYTKYVNKNQGDNIDETIISWYYLIGQNTAMRKMRNHQDIYILCVGYKEGDVQIGLTGGVTSNETHLECIKRELFEETMLCCDQNNITKLHQRKDNMFFCASINDCYFDTTPKPPHKNIIDEKPVKRSLLYLYGSYDCMKKAVDKMNVLNANEGITHYTLMALKDALRATGVLSSRQITKMKYKTFVYPLKI